MNFNTYPSTTPAYLSPIVDDELNLIRIDMYDIHNVCIGSSPVTDKTADHITRPINQAIFNEELNSLFIQFNPELLTSLTRSTFIDKLNEHKIFIKINKSMVKLEQMNPQYTFRELFDIVFSDLAGPNFCQEHADECFTITNHFFGKTT